MSRVALKVRKQYIEHIYNHTENATIRKRIPEIENYFFNTIASKANIEEYQHAMFHLLWLVKSNYNISTSIKKEEFLPANILKSSLTQITSMKSIPNITPNITPKPTKSATQQKNNRKKDGKLKELKEPRMPTVQKILKIKGLHSMLQCRRCPKQTEVVWCEVQTRSADEGGTIFCHCLKCNDRWRLT
jgi:DNA-directed RNA polymerase subunit M/transcription elongation factor TFIIS